MKSTKFTLNKRELVKGAMMAFAGGAIAFLQQITFSSFAQINWQGVLFAGLTPMLYFLYTFFESNK